jgi:hypothetical protein
MRAPHNTINSRVLFFCENQGVTSRYEETLALQVGLEVKENHSKA